MRIATGDARFPSPDSATHVAALEELGVFDEVDAAIGRLSADANVWGRPRRKATTKESQQVPTVRHK